MQTSKLKRTLHPTLPLGMNQLYQHKPERDYDVRGFLLKYIIPRHLAPFQALQGGHLGLLCQTMIYIYTFQFLLHLRL